MGNYDLLYAFADCQCPQAEDTDVVEDGGEAYSMLQYSLDMHKAFPFDKQWKEEVAFWRRMVQEAKKNKRRILTA